MKKLIVFLLVVGALYYVGKSGQFNLGVGGAPRVIANPVYAVIRFRTQFHDRTIDMVTYAKTFDLADCRSASTKLEDNVENNQRDDAPEWKLVSSECKSDLDARNAKLFDNKPTFANYVSATPGTSSEREVRLIFWGVTAQEGELMCGEVPRIQQRWKGAVTCIHALSSQ